MIDRALVLQARKASLEEYFIGKGIPIRKEGRQYRVKNHSGLVISGNMWYSHPLQRGGNTLDYLITVEGMSFKEAFEALVNIKIHERTFTDEAFRVDVPQRNSDDKRVMAYLMKTRGILPHVLLPLLKQGRIYQAASTHNAVFTGMDEDGSIRYVMQRSTRHGSNLKFESQGSDKRYSFSLSGQSDTLFIFESPIDLLSYLSLQRVVLLNQHHLLSLGGVSDIALASYIGKVTGIRTIVCCLDSDEAGKTAYSHCITKYTKNGFKVLSHFSEQKDWNHQLLYAPQHHWSI